MDLLLTVCCCELVYCRVSHSVSILLAAFIELFVRDLEVLLLSDRFEDHLLLQAFLHCFAGFTFEGRFIDTEVQRQEISEFHSIVGSHL